MSDRLRRWIDESFYPDASGQWDDEILRRKVLEKLGPESRLLDLGAGVGRVGHMDFRGHAARICGIDPMEGVLENPHLDEAKVARGEEIPYEDATFDVVIADNVLEHLEDPVPVFREVARVLVPGGFFLAKTPNRWHYVPLIARLTPHAFHQWFNRLRGRREDDTFPTFYRANSPPQIANCATAAGLEVAAISFHEGRPEYLRFSVPTYLAGLAYERVVNATNALASLRVVIVATLRKVGPTDP